jgi:hypothetical protein
MSWRNFPINWQCQLKPNSAPILQYGTGPSHNFLAKILGVNGPLLLFNIEFNFPHSLPLVCMSHKGSCTYTVCDSSAGNVSVYCVDGWGPKPMSVIALKAIKFHHIYIYIYIYIWIYLCLLFTIKNERSDFWDYYNCFGNSSRAVTVSSKDALSLPLVYFVKCICLILGFFLKSWMLPAAALKEDCLFSTCYVE